MNRKQKTQLEGTAPSHAHRLAKLRGQFVRVAGEPIRSEIERDKNPDRIDHFWITVRAGDFGKVRISVSTCSLRSRDRGFDPRVRLGILLSTWNNLPAPGVFESDGLDYASIEAQQTVLFQQYERPALETLLLETVNRAGFIESWGDLYLRGHPGIHQVHSRRASASVSTDHVGRDGAIRFYGGNAQSEMLLFKFFGQP